MSLFLSSGILEVQLLDAENISASSLEDEFYQSDSSVFMFADVQLSPQVRKCQPRSQDLSGKGRDPGNELEKVFESYSKCQS